MKIEVSDWNIVLRPENDEDKRILKAFDREGVKVGHTGSTLGINSPAIAGQRAIYLNRDEQSLLAYALGRIGSEQSKNDHYLTLLNKIAAPKENHSNHLPIER